MLLAHSEVGICPGCNMEIVDRAVADFDKEVRLAKPGDIAPRKNEWEGGMFELGEKGYTWLQAHFGVMYGTYPLVNIKPMDWVICLLHLNLRIVGSLFKELIVEKIGLNALDGQDQQEQLFDLLKSAHINMKKKKLARKPNTLQAAQQYSKLSLCGSEALIMMGIYPKLLNIILYFHWRRGRETATWRGIIKQPF